MNFLKIKTSWSNIELGLIKICVLSAGIILGTYFHVYLKNHLQLLGMVFLVTAVWTIYLWVKKVKHKI